MNSIPAAIDTGPQFFKVMSMVKLLEFFRVGLSKLSSSGPMTIAAKLTLRENVDRSDCLQSVNKIFPKMLEKLLVHRVVKYVSCSEHPSKCWQHSQLLNLRDQERHSYTVRYTPPLLMESSPRNLTWIFSGSLVMQRFPSYNNDTPVANGRHTSEHMPYFFSDDFHCRPRTTPRPYMDKHQKKKKKKNKFTRLDPNYASYQTPDSHRCHHFVSRSGHISKCLPCSPLPNLHDQERHSTASPES
jgi:hypothetical protein